MLRFTLLRNITMVIQTQECGDPRLVLLATIFASYNANLQGMYRARKDQIPSSFPAQLKCQPANFLFFPNWTI